MRLIDADALIEKCGEWYVEEGPEDGFIGTIKQLIDTQPTIIQSEQQWVPCSERLPEERDSCWPMDCLQVGLQKNMEKSRQTKYGEE